MLDFDGRDVDWSVLLMISGNTIGSAGGLEEVVDGGSFGIGITSLVANYDANTSAKFDLR